MAPALLQPPLPALLDRLTASVAPLRGELLAVCRGELPRTLLVTGCRPGDGASLSALILAAGLAGRARRRLLAGGGAAGLFGIAAAPGWAEAVRATDRPGLDLLPCGDAAGLFDQPDFKRRLDDLAAGYDHLLFAGPPLLGSSDTLSAARHFDAVVLVVRCGATRRREAAAAVERLRQVGAKAVATVLNRCGDLTMPVAG